MDDNKIIKLLQLKKLRLLYELGFFYHAPIEQNKKVSIPDIANIETFLSELSKCQLCNRCKSATAPLFDARKQERVSLLFVAFAPSKEEDLSRTQLGKHESEMVETMAKEVLKISKGDYRVSYMLRCYAPTLNTIETHMCYPYLLKEIELLKPKVVVALDAKALQLLCNDEAIDFDAHIGSAIKEQTYTITALYHPNYLIHNPSAKKRAYQALLAIKRYL